MLAKKADLLCAIRLPETAFAVTGAKVSTDILFFQKRRYQTVGDEPEWVNIAQEANMYFGTHLNHMLGRMMEESGPYGKRFVCKEKEGRTGKHVLIIFIWKVISKMFMNQVRQLRITMKNMFRQ